MRSEIITRGLFGTGSFWRLSWLFHNCFRVRRQGYVGYARGHLHNRLKGHKQQSSASAKHYKNVHGREL